MAKLAEYLKNVFHHSIWYYTNYILKPSKFFPTQPEIDLITCRIEKTKKLPPIYAAEVKYLRTTKDGHVNLSYYSGLDEALALLILGFDHVSLIHLIEKELFMTDLLYYVRTLSDVMRELNLPIGYRVYAVSISENNVFFYRSVASRSGHIDLDKLWVEPPSNPLLTAESEVGELARKNRKRLANNLGISLEPSVI